MSSAPVEEDQIVSHGVGNRWLLRGLVVVGAGLSLTAAWLIDLETQGDFRAELVQRAQDLKMEVMHTLDQSADVLHGMRVLLNESDEVTPEEFAAAARDFRRRHEMVSALEWVTRVKADEREAFEAQLVARGFADGRIKDQVEVEAQEVRPAVDRAEYFPVTYIEPLEPNRWAIGFDVSGAPSWPSRLSSARTDRVGGSRITFLLQGDVDAPKLGWLMHLPVYSRPNESNDEAWRLAHLRGFLLGVFSLEDLFGASAATQLNTQLDLLVYDAREGTKPVAVYYRNAAGEVRFMPEPPPEFMDDRDGLSVMHRIEVGQSVWHLKMRASEAWRLQRRSWAPVVVFLLGTAVTGLLTLLVAQMRRRHEAVQREVEVRTAELWASRQEIEGLLENSPNIIFVKNLERRYVSVNQRFCDLMGRRKEDVLGRCDEELFPEEEAARYREADEKVLWERQQLTSEDCSDVGAREVVCIVHKFALYDAAGSIRGLCGIGTDITERKRMESDRLAVERKMQETQRLESLGVMAGGIAHDFNNLLTGVVGNASLAAARLPPDSAIAPMLEDILMASARAAELCRQMLDYSGRSRLVSEPVHLNGLIEELLPLLRHTVNKSTTMMLGLDPGLPRTLADASQLRQVVMNLVINGSESLEGAPGQVKIETGTQPELRERGVGAVIERPDLDSPLVVIRVSDTGSGMDAATLARVFDPFFTTKFTGRGLGLAAVLGIVRSHGGGLWVESRAGLGTMFEIVLPAVSEVADENAQTTRIEEAAWRGSGEVLVIDDEDGVRRVIVRALQSFGFEGIEARDGEAGLKIFGQNPSRFRCVLLDLTMPGLSGEDVWLKLRALNPTIRVILMSGYSRQIIAGRWSHEDPAGVLPKPFSISDLRDVIRDALA